MSISDYRIRISLSTNVLSTSQDTFIPTSLFQPLPTHTPKTVTRNSSLSESCNKDYRFGPIRLDWIDFGDMSSMKAFFSGKEKEQQGSGRITSSAAFVPNLESKSGSANLPDGVIHIFKDSSKQLHLLPEAEQQSGATPSGIDNTTLAILAVPSWMTPSDFLTFVAPVADSLKHLRVIRDSLPNRSIAVMKFRKEQDAAEFAEAYNGKQFNSMEAETCHVVRVTDIKIELDDAVSQAIARLGDDTSTELPTCPVCLERMDSAVTGLVTVPCAHTFHCMCLSKWGDSRCPVCRYSQTLMTSHPTSSSRTRPAPFDSSGGGPPGTLSSCADCGSTTNLWICLVCGNVGCGRYGRAHAHAHYNATSHVYALELETQRVWDYAGDGYVHRLIRNRTDGKLVELPSASMGTAEGGDGRGPSEKDALGAEKIEAIGIEYSYLLMSQLDSQREWYEERAEAMQHELAEMKAIVERAERARLEDDTRRAEVARGTKEGEDERANLAERERARAEKRTEKLTELARRLEKELREERAVSEGLMKNMSKLKQRTDDAEAARVRAVEQVRELEDNLRDVMFALELQSKIAAGGEVAEVAGGSVEVPAPIPTPSKGKKARNKK